MLKETKTVLIGLKMQKIEGSKIWLQNIYTMLIQK